MVLTLSGQAVFTMIVEYDIEKNHEKKNHRGIKKIGKEKWRDSSSSMCHNLDDSPCFGHFFFLVLCKIAKYLRVQLLNLLTLAWWWVPSLYHAYLFSPLYLLSLTVYLQYWNVTVLELGVGTSTSHCFLDSCGKH